MKQTAVEWLAEQMLWNEFHNPYLEKAKEMEKEQMNEAYKEGYFVLPRDVDFKKYYEETYGKK